MWLAILNFSLFILLIGFLFYGLTKWTKLITEYEDGSENVKKESNDNKEDVHIVDERYYRVPLWILLVGIAISQIIGFLKYSYEYFF